MSHTLPDLIDIPDLQILMDRFYAATEIPVGIIASDGKILVATGWQEICTHYHRVHPASAERCRQSDDYIKAHLSSADHVQYKCHNGLWDTAVPIVIAGQHVATLFLGQFFFDDEIIDEEYFRQQARKFGFDETAYIEALRKVPVFSRERIRQIMEFYSSFVNLLVSMGLAKQQCANTEKTLRVSETEKSVILDSTVDLIVFHDTDMKVVWANRQAHESVGLELGELSGRNCWEIWHKKAGPCERCPVILARDTGEPQEAEITSLDGRQWYIRGFPIKEDGGTIKGVVEFCLDITQRKQAEEALRHSEEKFATAFLSAPSILSISSLADGRFIEVNDTFVRVTGYSRNEVIGRTSIELKLWQAPEDRSRFIEEVREHGSVRRLEARLRTRSGENLVGLLSADIIQVDGEQCLLILIEDVTERKTMEEEIETLNTVLAGRATELEQANQELEAFNYSVSHDLRSPLTGIIGYSELLLNTCTDKLDGIYLESLRSIHETALQMDDLIDTMLRFSRLSRGEITLSRVDLSAIAQDVIAHLKLQDLSRNLTVSIDDELTAEGDEGLLRVVLENLLGNAWKYTRDQQHPEIRVGAVEADGVQAFFVSDNGVGFDMWEADKLFRPFERLSGTRDFSGHGIGLATVQRIIQRHGGRVWGQGEKGKGATFFFTLQGENGQQRAIPWPDWTRYRNQGHKP